MGPPEASALGANTPSPYGKVSTTFDACNFELVVTDPHSHKQTHPHKQTGPITIHCATASLVHRVISYSVDDTDTQQ